MKDLMKFAIVGVFVFALTSCNEVANTGGIGNLDNYIHDAAVISGEPLPAEYVAKNDFRCYYTSKGFLGSMQLQNKKLVHLADLQSGKLKMSACALGRGPGEILLSSPDMDLLNDNLYLLDSRKDEIKRVKIQQDTLITYDVMKLDLETPMIYLNLQAVSDSLFMIFGSGIDNIRRLIFMDINNNVVDSLAYYPLEDEEIDQSSCNFNVDMELSPCHNFLFVSCNQYDCISKYEIKDNKIQSVKKIFLSEPKYSVKQGKPVYSMDYISCNSSIYVGEKYVYITVDPESVKDYRAREEREKAEGVRGSAKPGNDSYILVLDYNLNMVKSYLSDSDISNLALTSDPSVVYATNSRENRLVKYTLPGLK